jgi:hypothetical protein
VQQGGNEMSLCEVEIYDKDTWVKAKLNNSVHNTPRLVWKQGYGWVELNQCMYCYKDIEDHNGN